MNANISVDVCIVIVVFDNTITQWQQWVYTVGSI